MKSKHKNDCLECRGTGEHRQKNGPTLKCTECDGSGKAEHFEMMFWSYDTFPFILASRGFLRDDGTCYCPSYNACFRPIKVMSLEEGQALADKLDALEKEHDNLRQEITGLFKHRLQQIAPWAISD